MKHKKRSYYLFTLGGLLIFAALVLSLKTYQRLFFEKTATGLQYQISSKGKGPSPQEGDVLLLDVCYKTDKGKVLFDTSNHELPMTLPYAESFMQKDGGFLEAVSMLQKKGDGLVCKLSPEKMFGENLDHVTAQYGLEKKEKIFLYLQLQNIMSEKAHKKWESEQVTMLQTKYKEKIEQQHTKDIKAIVSYLEVNRIAAKSSSSGLYYVIDTPGQGIQPKQGDKAKVNYIGRLLDGKVFDTSSADVAEQYGIHNPQRTYEAITFKLGVGQVIRGWDEGIMYLRKGAKARLFIPSTLAYGDRSIANDLIPANSILIYDVELVDIQR